MKIPTTLRNPGVTASLALALLACLQLASCGPSPQPAITQPTPGPQVSASAAPSASASSSPSSSDLKVNNLIRNPGAEIAQGSQPAFWQADFYGELSAQLAWKNDSPYSGLYYLSTQVSNYGAEGDAKWIFDPVPLNGGQWYEYRDQYRSDGRSRQIYSCRGSDGNRRFYNASQTHTSPSWHESVFRFYLPQDCEVSVLHTLDRNGYLDTDHHQLRKVATAGFQEGLVSITFDDIWKTAFSKGLPELSKRGFKGSFYVTRLFSEEPGRQYANREDLLEIIRQGHEVASHSNTHKALSTQDLPTLLEDIRRSQNFLKELGVQTSGIAYPFGDFDDKVDTEVKRFHTYARTSLSGLNDQTSSRYRLKIIAVTTDTSTAELLRWIQAAYETRTWLIFLFHDLGTALPQNPYTTPFEQYTQVLDEIKAKGLKVVTVEQGLKETGL